MRDTANSIRKVWPSKESREIEAEVLNASDEGLIFLAANFEP
jgi:hypothetical protein